MSKIQHRIEQYMYSKTFTYKFVYGILKQKKYYSKIGKSMENNFD